MPSKNHPFLVMVAGFAGNHHQKRMILGGRMPSKPPAWRVPRKSCQLQDLRSRRSHGRFGGPTALQDTYFSPTLGGFAAQSRRK
jgi:hypothetical protein